MTILAVILAFAGPLTVLDGSHARADAGSPVSPDTDTKGALRELSPLVGPRAPVNLTAGQGAAMVSTATLESGERKLCRLRVRLRADPPPEFTSGTLSMSVNHRTCMQVIIARDDGGGLSVDYVGLITSGREPLSSGATKELELLNFAQNDDTTGPDLVTVLADAGLTGVDVALLPGTSLLASTKTVREVAVRAVTTPLGSVTGDFEVRADRAQQWAGRTGDLTVEVRRLEGAEPVLQRTFVVDSDDSVARRVDMADVQAGTYLLHVSASGFNAPTYAAVVQKRSPSLRLPLILLGVLLVFVGSARELRRSGRRGHVLLGVLGSVAALLALAVGLRLANGEVRIGAVEAASIGVEDGTVLPQQFPVGSLESTLTDLAADWADDGRGLVHLFRIPPLSEAAVPAEDLAVDVICTLRCPS